MAAEKDCFSDEELTALANQISSDVLLYLDTDNEDDITIKAPLTISGHEEYHNHSGNHKYLSSGDSFSHSLQHNHNNIPLSKPRLSIVDTNQMPANDSFNIPLPPIPYKEELENNGLIVRILSKYIIL